MYDKGVSMLQIKNFKLKSKIIQSPMAGCTDLAFRLIAREHGMEFAFLEMVHCEPLIRNREETLRLLKSTEADRPLGAQLVGCNPESMGKAAAMIEDMGFDWVDINFGCPVPVVTGKGGGSALLREPVLAHDIFEQVTKSVKHIPATVKMRLGYEDPSGNEAIKIAKIAEEAGLSAISVHGRTRAQRYTGKADWTAIGRIKDAVNIPVFGNGDITNSEEALQMLKESGADGVMIGRGGLGNPWVYKQVEAAMNGAAEIPAPTLEEQRQAALKHLKLEIEFEGEKIGILKSRRIVCWYFKNVPGSNEFRFKVNRTETYAEMKHLIENFEPLSSCPSALESGNGKSSGFFHHT